MFTLEELLIIRGWADCFADEAVLDKIDLYIVDLERRAAILKGD